VPPSPPPHASHGGDHGGDGGGGGGGLRRRKRRGRRGEEKNEEREWVGEEESLQCLVIIIGRFQRSPPLPLPPQLLTPSFIIMMVMLGFLDMRREGFLLSYLHQPVMVYLYIDAITTSTIITFPPHFFLVETDP